MKKPVNMTLDEDLFRRFRIRAIEENTSASAIIDGLMEEYLAHPSDSRRSRGAVEDKAAHRGKARHTVRENRARPRRT